MPSKARLEGELSWTDSAFVRGISRATNMSRRFAQTVSSSVGGQITSAVAKAGAAIGVYLGARAFASGILGATRLGGSITDLRARSGLTTTTILALQQSMEDASVSADTLWKASTKLGKKIEETDENNRASRETWEKLGIDWKALKELSPDEQLLAVGQAIGKIESPTKKAAIAMDIFGKSGGELLSVFSNEAFGKLPSFLEAQAELLEKDAAIFDDVSDKLDRSGTVARGFWLGVADKIAPVLNGVLDRFEATDWVGIGKAFGDGILNAGKILAAIWDAPMESAKGLGLAMLASAAEFGNTLIAEIQTAGKMVGAAFQIEWVQALGKELMSAAHSFSAAILGGIARNSAYIGASFEFAFQKAIEFFENGMRTVINNVNAFLESGIQDAMESIGKIPGVGKLFGLQGFKAESFERIQERNAENNPGSGFKAETFQKIFDRQLGQSFFRDVWEDQKQKAEDSAREAGELMDKGARDMAVEFNKAIADSTKTPQDVFGAADLAAKAEASKDRIVAAGDKMATAIESGASSVSKSIASASSKISPSTKSDERDAENIKRFGFKNRGELRKHEQEQAREQRQFERGINGRTGFEKAREGMTPAQRQKFDEQNRKADFDKAFHGGKEGGPRSTIKGGGKGLTPNKDWREQFMPEAKRLKDNIGPVQKPDFGQKKNEAVISEGSITKLTNAIDKLLMK